MRRFTHIGAYGLAIQNDKVLLTTKKKGPYTGLLDLIGGGIEFGEEVEYALKREFIEEVAMTFNSIEWFGNLTYSGKTKDPNGEEVEFHHIGMVYVIDQLTQIENGVAEDEFAWYAIKELTPEKLTPFAIATLAKIL